MTNTRVAAIVTGWTAVALALTAAAGAWYARSRFVPAPEAPASPVSAPVAAGLPAVQPLPSRSADGSHDAGPPRRNPFRLREETWRPAANVELSAPAPLDAAPRPDPGPALALVGIAESRQGASSVLTAVIAGGGDLWLVKDGEPVAGRYRVERVVADGVTLRDVVDGTSRTLRLPR